MRTKRNLLLLAVGGVAGYVVGRHPEGVSDTVRSTADLARARARKVSSSTLGRSGDHRGSGTPAPESADSVVERTSTAYVARPRP
ncbi:hypothetical protein J2S40_001185 [Nocardioides luteus]|uniref:YtxH domain-containing protein n=1 Tax=Nocardioides luteus TaxID=1844 RepID=A0ABQ5SSJ3_9ACTN|nr:hypothetical protein [Nocardioides luteus]MDR7310127.1 hypothetical protein [Nocardioides luteus]GGR64624.1 hypothetical protein GCM10010197_35050 [Nocardioides luteus]GLJ66965.1 hypothetical protein GCM10017579_10010 [Nocardioides luteus]